MPMCACEPSGECWNADFQTDIELSWWHQFCSIKHLATLVFLCIWKLEELVLNTLVLSTTKLVECPRISFLLLKVIFLSSTAIDESMISIQTERSIKDVTKDECLKMQMCIQQQTKENKIADTYTFKQRHKVWKFRLSLRTTSKKETIISALHKSENKKYIQNSCFLMWLQKPCLISAV